jgi:hypothetical protein
VVDAVIRCPNCGTEIPVSEALTAQLREQIQEDLSGEYEARIERAGKDAAERAREQLALELRDLEARLAEQNEKARLAQERELGLRKQARALEEQSRTQAEQIRAEVEGALRKGEAEHVAQATAAAEARVREQSQLELKQLQADLAAQRERARQSQEAELALRKEKTVLEERARELDLEVARRLDAAKAELETGIRKAFAEEQGLKLKEKEKQIADLRQALEDARRRSELGSQELQGEVLELDIESALERQFPQDRIEPVPKGIRGADILQRVIDSRGRDCGSIVWETKNTKHWQPAWLDKLKQDQRAVGAGLAVLVSVAVPDEIVGFGNLDGVWVSDLRSWPALAAVLRQQLVQVAFAHAASENKSEKMELLYHYLAGDQFRSRVQGIVEAFTGMQDQLARERRAMERLWREREKQIERVVTNTVGMYGEMRGLIGSSLPEIPALALDGSLLEDRDDD